MRSQGFIKRRWPSGNVLRGFFKHHPHALPHPCPSQTLASQGRWQSEYHTDDLSRTNCIGETAGSGWMSGIHDDTIVMYSTDKRAGT